MSSHKLTFDEFGKLVKMLYTKFMQICTNRRRTIERLSTSLIKQGEVRVELQDRSRGSITQNASTRTPIIREFEPFKISKDIKHLIVGSSITASIRTEIMPNDTIIYSYRSTGGKTEGVN